MKLGRLTLRRSSLRLRSRLRTARAIFDRREGLECVIDAGVLEGRGEAMPLEEFGTESLAQSEQALEAASGFFEGRPLPEDLASIDGLVTGCDALVEAPAARHAVETALLDLLSRVQGVPLERLLGGTVREVRLNALLTAVDPGELAAQAQDAVAEGFSTLKLKVGGRPLVEDVRRLEAVRASVGPEIALRIDANGGWSREEAIAALNAFKSLEIQLCEQPTADLAQLRGAVPCLIAADELVTSEDAARDLIASNAADVLVLRPMVLGGVLPALRIAREAAARGVRCYVASSLEGRVGRRAALALAAAMPDGGLAHGLATGALLDDEILIAGERRWTRSELEREVTRFATGLHARGVGPGARIAVVSGNRPEVVFGFHAAGRLGAVWVPLNARLTADELHAQLAKLDPALVLVDPDSVPRIEGAVSLTAIASDGPAPARRRAQPTDVRAMLFTSGTTGAPKAAELTWGNLAASARASAENLGGGPEQVWLACMPLFHVGGLAMVDRCRAYGATLILHERFDAAAVASALRDHRVTHLSMVATALRWLLEQLPQPPPSLRAVLVGGGPVDAALLERARAAGWPVLQTYGLTEACSQVCTERLHDADGRSAGSPLHGLEVRVLDPAGHDVPVGSEGELIVKGPTVMRGYFADAESTARVLRDGWLWTGDVGALDEQGRLRVLARRTDLIVSGGENVYPAEIEAVLTRHPEISEAAVVGVDDPTWGQIPTALYVANAASVGGPEALESWCRAQLAGFKVPKRFVSVGALPRTATGKVDRGQLRALLAAVMGNTGLEQLSNRVN